MQRSVWVFAKDQAAGVKSYALAPWKESIQQEFDDSPSPPIQGNGMTGREVAATGFIWIPLLGLAVLLLGLAAVVGAIGWIFTIIGTRRNQPNRERDNGER